MATKKDISVIFRAKDKTRGAIKAVKNNLSGVTESLNNFVFSVRGLLTGALFGSIGSYFTGLTRKSENLRASLETVTQSSEDAAQILRLLEANTGRLNSSVGELGNSWIKLVNAGIEPSIDRLEAFINVASANPGKTLDQYVEAVADALRGEFERLKEFGISASKQGDQIEFTFRNVSKTVKNTSEEIGQYLEELGRVEFAGGIKRQAETIDGAFRRLNANIERLGKTVNKGGGVGDGLRSLINDLANLAEQANATAALELGDPSQIGGVEEVNRQINVLYQELERLQRLGPMRVANLFLGGPERVKQEVDRIKDQISELIKYKGQLAKDEAEIEKKQSIEAEANRHRQRMSAIQTAETNQLKQSLDDRVAALNDYIDELKNQNKELEDSAKGFGDLIAELDQSIKDKLIQDAGLENNFLDRHIDQASQVLDLYEMISAAQSALDKGDFQTAAGISQGALEQLEKMRDDGSLANQSLLDLARSFKEINDEASKGTELGIEVSSDMLEAAKQELKDIKANAKVSVEVPKEQIEDARRQIETGLAAEPVRVPVEVEVTAVSGMGGASPELLLERESDKRGYRL